MNPWTLLSQPLSNPFVWQIFAPHLHAMQKMKVWVNKSLKPRIVNSSRTVIQKENFKSRISIEEDKHSGPVWYIDHFLCSTNEKSLDGMEKEIVVWFAPQSSLERREIWDRDRCRRERWRTTEQRENTDREKGDVRRRTNRTRHTKREKEIDGSVVRQRNHKEKEGQRLSESQREKSESRYRREEK